MTDNDKVPWDPDYDPRAEIDVLNKRCDQYERDLRRLLDANRSLGEALKAALQTSRTLARTKTDPRRNRRRILIYD
jgi:cob(I)alamin adenosyltransferase